ncbi:hypothetical protein LP417_24250 [Polaromonas sp. P1-6]|nr:hypothetical protein LP417_24250 [Polaromonas sp. P1-6]
MLAAKLLAEGFGDRIQSLGRMFDAIDEIVSILAFVALVERERFQAGEADQIGVFDLLGRDAVVAQQLGLNLGNLVEVEDDAGSPDRGGY